MKRVVFLFFFHFFELRMCILSLLFNGCDVCVCAFIYKVYDMSRFSPGFVIFKEIIDAQSHKSCLVVLKVINRILVP